MSGSILIVGSLAAQLLTDFRPSEAKSEYGVVSEVEFGTPVLELEPGSLAHHLPHAMKDYRFREAVWVIAYKTEVVDAQGRPPAANYLCHTFFGDQRVVQKQDAEMRAVYSDHYTPEVRLPEGLGIRLTPEDSLHWMPMFNNREIEPTRVSMKVRLRVIRDKDVRKPLRPVYSTLRSVQVPHLYFVAPGRDEKQVTFELPFDGRIHFVGSHIHPYGVSMELYNETRGERVWLGKPREVYSSAEGYGVKAGERYRITAVYENPTKAPIDAMAGMFLFYTRN
jgi:hypothetical protein